MKRVENLARHMTSASSSSVPSSGTNSEKKKGILGNDWEMVKDLSVEQLRERYGKVREGGLVLDGINHIAYVSSNMARTVWFWNEILGLRLTKTIALPGNGQHFFLDGGRGASLAYFYFPDAPQQHPGISTVDLPLMKKGGSFSTAHGSVNHTAFNVSRETLLVCRKKNQITWMLCHSNSLSQ